jgi:lipid-binding SYLF domain-containing protein
MKTIRSCLVLTLALGITANAADETAARLNRAAAVFAKMTESEHGIRKDRIANADCIAVIPGFKKGAEAIDVVVLSLDKSRRTKLLSDRFTIGSDASAAWGNGKSAHEDPNAQVVFYGQTKGVFAGFALDGATLKRDQSGDKALYGKDATNGDIVDSAATPAIAQPFVDKLAQAANR